jgi:hypothetical protein
VRRELRVESGWRGGYLEHAIAPVTLMTLIPAIVLGVPACCLGIVLAIYSSLRAAKIRGYVIENSLAPELTKSYYFARFHFGGVSAAYEKATGDRTSVWLTYVTGILGMLLLVGGGMLMISHFAP